MRSLGVLVSVLVAAVASLNLSISGAPSFAGWTGRLRLHRACALVDLRRSEEARADLTAAAAVADDDALRAAIEAELTELGG